MKKVCCLIAVALTATPAAALSPNDVSKAFVEGVEVCLESALTGVAVKDLPLAFADRLRATTDFSQSFIMSPSSKGQLWNLKTADGIAQVAQMEDGRCVVFAYGPPVKKTFAAASKAVLGRQAGFVSQSVADDYYPIAESLTRTEAGQTITVTLNGNEPGAAGHAFRFSKLNAQIVRSAAPAAQ